MADPLHADEIARYARHIILPEIGGGGQQKLKAARVLVVGAGGLGAPLIAYLAAAGIGRLGIVDDDTVSLSNLQRQIIHDTDAIGMAKVDSAATAVARINPHVAVDRHGLRLTEENAAALLSGYDIAVDGSDNFATRYLVADAAEAARVPLVTGAVGRFDGSVTVLAPFDTDAEGAPLPRYRDLFPERPPEGAVPTCAEAGIVGALPGVVGTLMAMEVIKFVTGAGTPLLGRLLIYDALEARFDTIRYRRPGSTRSGGR
ncbi:molybdopterin-synthase adenylyltransferase MoeB [Ensifer soli]|uniref:molybdopterin-synthase adenylyltransferase MoeB n=1 Tax=Ciceribacter sp. sgz301302 TaxID=3342379 RepID=UPI0035B765C2